MHPGLTDPATIKYCREAKVLAQVPESLRHFEAVVTPDELRISHDYLERASLMSGIRMSMRQRFWRCNRPTGGHGSGVLIP
jgi:hypothetical protein